MQPLLLRFNWSDQKARSDWAVLRVEREHGIPVADDQREVVKILHLKEWMVQNGCFELKWVP